MKECEVISLAFVNRKPTDEEIKYLDSYEIRCPYGNKSSYEEVFFDGDRCFYMFYIMGPGFKRESLPMYFGIVWKEKPMILGVYKTSIGSPSQGLHISWDFCSLVGKNNEFIAINEEIINTIKEALFATDGCTSCKVVETKFNF